MTELEDERDPRLATEVDRYTIVRLLGKGGMGRVYEARHARLGRRVAIKFLLPDLAGKADILRRFENEAMAAGGLEHPNLVAVIDLGRATDGAPYLVMEYLQGEDCARLLRRAGPLPATRAANLVLQACRGVEVAHAAGVIHRDLKPENLFVVDAGDGTDLVKVLDFGIAKLRPAGGEATTRTGSIFGTTHYMSPEQARGAAQVDARTDVWSLGVVLYELLAGRRPFDGDDPLHIVHQILTTTPPALDALRAGLPAGLADVVGKALRKDIDARFPTVHAFAMALSPFADRATRFDAPASAGPTSTRLTPDTTARPSERRSGSRARAVGTALALVAAGVGIVTASIASTHREPASAPPSAPAAVVGAPTAAPVAPPPATIPTQAAASAEAPRPSGQSKHAEHAEHAEHVEHAEHAAPSSTVRARRRPSATAGAIGHSDAAPHPTTTSPASSAPVKRTLTLDPNPY